MEFRVLSIQSHVVHGYVGNRAAAFVLQRLGIEVDVIETVQFSNHTKYPVFKGNRLSGEDLKEIYSGLASNGLNKHSHILSGYVGSGTALQEVVEIVKDEKSANPELIFVCDPVMGDNGEPYVPEEVMDIYKCDVTPLADVLLPNQYEVEFLTGLKLESDQDAAIACAKLHEKGPHTVVITSMETVESTDGYMMLHASTARVQSPGHLQKFKIEIPKIDYHFTGSGDALAALIVGMMIERPSELDWVCEQAVSRLHSLLQRTVKKGKKEENLELDLVSSQSCLIQPDFVFKAVPCD